MKYILILAAISILSTEAMADRRRHRSDGQYSSFEVGSTVASLYSYSTSNDTQVVIYKENVKLVLEDAIEVLQGLPASDEFMELHVKLENYTGDSLTEVEAARLIIKMSQDV